jgi:hypothetical protein
MDVICPDVIPTFVVFTEIAEVCPDVIPTFVVFSAVAAVRVAMSLL